MTEHASKLPLATRPGRVALAVEDLYGTSSFYEDVVGLNLFDYTETTGTLGVEETPLVKLKDGGDRSLRTDAQAGLYHVAFEYPSRSALGSALERVESFYELEGATDHGVSESLYLTDPAGNGVELFVPGKRDEWPTNDAGEVVMETDPLDLDDLRAAGAGETNAPAETRVGHFHLEVTALFGATEFYRDALGLPLAREIGDMARFFSTGDTHHQLGVTNYLGRTEPATGRGVDWIEFLVPDAGVVSETAQRFEAAGVDVEDRSAGIAVTDPDGIGVRVRPDPAGD
ncbi:VOC family protein [Halodesulfurarchaeum sp.]|uniref:VOC family protein n=1 Tax=Halodesulfurarchaeum sp. TaxID=1980530 RepID=UPI001BBE2723|nr:VOC family protein [Halodesulfurarchaeum sp.]